MASFIYTMPVCYLGMGGNRRPWVVNPAESK